MFSKKRRATRSPRVRLEWRAPGTRSKSGRRASGPRTEVQTQDDMEDTQEEVTETPETEQMFTESSRRPHAVAS